MSKTSPQPLDLFSTPITPGITLIEASAGTGKTYCLTQLAVRMLLEGTVKDVSRLLVVTFTNAATDELVRRVRARLREAAAVFAGQAGGDEFLRALRDRHGEAGRARLEDALLRFDEVSICTIHSFCRRVLEKAAFESGMPFEAEFLESEADLLDQAAADFWRRQCYENGLLAALAARGDLDKAESLDAYRLWRRHPGTQVVPASAPLKEATERFAAALKEARRAWNPQRIESLLRSLKWSKNSPMGDDVRADTLDLAGACLQGEPGPGLDAALAFAPDALREAAFQKFKDKVPADPFFDACGELDAARAALEHSWRGAFIAAVEADFERGKARRHVLTFDDLLRRLDHALADRASGARVAEAVRSQYQAALIDEFQDTDPIQCRIFTTALAGRPLVFVGDPKQAIYTFRGADVFAYLDAKKRAAREFTLDCNHRSESRMVAAVNALFGRAADPFLVEDIPFRDARAAGKADGEPLAGDGKGALQWWFLPPERGVLSKELAGERILNQVAAEVVRLLSGSATIGGRPVQPRDIAVLTRTNTQAQDAQRRLRKAGVASVVAGAGNILESREMNELAAVLRAIHDPRDDAAVRAAQATELWGLDAAAIHARMNDDAFAQALADRLDSWRETWLHDGFMPAVERFLAEEDARRRLLAHDDGERRLTNVLHAAEVLHRAAEEQRLSPEGLFKWLDRARSGAPEDADFYELRLESDADAVQIVTIHKSKGLEYGIVFCPFLWDARTPDLKKPALVHADGGIILDFGAKDDPVKQEHAEMAERERLAEDLRLAYVAVTRAKHRAYVAAGAVGRDKGAGSALAHLLGGTDPRPLASEHPDAMGVETIAAGPVSARWQPPAPAPVTLAPRAFPPDLGGRLAPWTMASYSSFIARSGAREEPEHDDPPAPAARADAAPEGIFAFGRGPLARAHADRTGTCLHEILERADLAAADSEETTSLVRKTLDRYGLLAPGAHRGELDPVATVCAMLRRVGAARLPGAGFALADVPHRACMAEWPFYMPLAPLAPRELEKLFAEKASAPVRESYPPYAATLSSRQVHGYLNGFVDLLFERGGRWHVVDWKSNHLGDGGAAYAPDALRQVMCEDHYVLQYHLYCAAADRYLRTRMPDYDYERHFGGAWYVFLRGVDGAGGGIYHDLPPRAMIEALGERIIRRATP